MEADSKITPEMKEAFEAQVNANQPAIDNEPEDLSGDGGVMKTILKEGNGWQKPNNGISVKVHYTGTLTNGTKFDSSVDRGQLFSFKLGAGQVIKGWDITVATMRLGEKCKVVLAPEYAYGARGSPPTIPANATLVFEIELFEFDNETDISPNKDGGIKKLETKASTGVDSVSYDANVEIKYTISLEDETVLLSNKTDSFIIGEERYPVGVEIAVASLKEGGAANFKIAAPYAYGSAGNSELNIPPNVKTIWNIELTSLKNPPSPSSLDATEKLKVANEKKSDGNSMFTQGKWKRALEKYKFAITYTEYIGGDQAKEADDLKTVCRLNVVQCYLKMQNYDEAIKEASQVLKSHPDNIKGLYRRALAYHAQNLYTEAIADLEHLLKVENNADATKELARIKAKVKAQEQKERQTFARMFTFD